MKLCSASEILLEAFWKSWDYEFMKAAMFFLSKLLSAVALNPGKDMAALKSSRLVLCFNSDATFWNIAWYILWILVT